MLLCRAITISSTAGFAASVLNMPGAKPNCLRSPSRMLCAPAGVSSRVGAVSRDTVDGPPSLDVDYLVHIQSERQVSVACQAHVFAVPPASADHSSPASFTDEESLALASHRLAGGGILGFHRTERG